MSAFTLLVNGTERRVQAPPQTSLLSVLREQLQLTGTKYGCGEGMCGACTVLMDGKAVRSCRTPLAEAAGRKILTIEGLERNGQLHPVQAAFLRQEALQCGFCTPGMILSAIGLLTANPNPSEAEIVRSMNGNLCRCGTYPRIVAAIKQAAAARGGLRG
jgi:aerobic-type carbon monoxide dehydrogenase small subunit (CoxS/CutS family)